MSKMKKYILPAAPILVLGLLVLFDVISADTAISVGFVVEAGLVIYLSWKNESWI